jgi:hypothetical protein
MLGKSLKSPARRLFVGGMQSCLAISKESVSVGTSCAPVIPAALDPLLSWIKVCQVAVTLMLIPSQTAKK